MLKDNSIGKTQINVSVFFSQVNVLESLQKVIFSQVGIKSAWS